MSSWLKENHLVIDSTGICKDISLRVGENYMRPIVLVMFFNFSLIVLHTVSILHYIMFNIKG